MDPIKTTFANVTHLPDEQGQIRYRERPAGRLQRRFKGRTILEPDVYPFQFDCRAVIDWIELSFVTGRSTQMRYLQQAVVDLGLRRPNVKDAGDGHTWTIRVQAPEAADLIHLRRLLIEKFDVNGAIGIAEMEISVDFYPRNGSEDLRRKFVAVLRQTILPRWFVWDEVLTRPRVIGMVGGPNFLMPDLPFRRDRVALLAGTGSDIDADSTFYIGAKDGQRMIRIMDKKTDVRKTSGSGPVELNPDERRARVEVVLRGEALHRHGLRCLEDLFSVSLAKLQGENFHFMLPTVTSRQSAGRSWERSLARWKDLFDLRAFPGKGVIGMHWHRQEHWRVFKQEVNRLRSSGGQAKKKLLPRLTDKPTDTFAAFEELNEVVQVALALPPENWTV